MEKSKRKENENVDKRRMYMNGLEFEKVGWLWRGRIHRRLLFSLISSREDQGIYSNQYICMDVKI